jgi:hypothetical protein
MRTLWSGTAGISRLIRTVGVAGAITVAFALVPALHAVASTASDAAASRSLVNSARAAAGLHGLSEDSRLDVIAAAQAQRMADRDAIYHNPNLKSDADAAGVNWQWIGENVGVGPDVQTIHEAFMASPGHHANIVYPGYTVVGTGAAVGKDGSIFIVQDFAGLMASSPASTTPAVSAAPAPVAAAPAAPVVHHAAPPTQTPVRSVTPTAAPVSVAAAVVTPAPSSDENAVVGGVVDTGTQL